MLAINIDVKTQPITDARRQLEMLGRSINNVKGMGALDIGPNGEDLARIGEMRRAAERLGSIRTSGERSGGLSSKEFQQASRYMQDLSKGVREWHKELNGVKTTMFALSQQQRSLAGKVHGGTATAEDRETFSRNKERLGELQAQRRHLEAEEQRVRQYGMRGSLSASNISQMDERSPLSSAGISALKKTMGLALAAAGGFSLASMIGSARTAYQNNLGEESTLHARGLRSYRNIAGAATGLGMGPAETYGLLDQLSTSTGLNEKTGIGKHGLLTASFAKFAGVGIDAAAGTRQGVYAATGNAGDLPSAVLMAVGKTTREGIDKSRLPELLSLVNRNTQATAQAMGGAGVSKNQLAADLSLAIASMKIKGDSAVFAKSQEFAGVMQNGLQGAGTGAGDIRLFSAMGGFNGPMTWEKIHEMNLVKQGGFMQRPDLLNKILGGLSGSTASKAGQLESMFPQWNLGAKGSQTLVEMQQQGFFTKLQKSGKSMVAELESQSKGGNSEAARWLSEIKSNPALAKENLEATKQIVRIEAGDQLNKLFSPLEMSLAKFSDALIHNDLPAAFKVLSNAGDGMGTAAKVMAGAAGLFALGGALSAVGGLSSLKGGAAAGMLSRLAPMLLNPTTAGVAAIGGTFGAIGWAGADNDKNLKRGQSDKELTDRYHQLEVQGNPNGPEGQRIKAELQRRKAGGAAAQPKPRGWFQHQDAIRHSAMLYNVPLPILAGLLESESDLTNSPMRTEHYANGKPFRVGGIAQFTEATAKARGVDPMNPASAIPGSAKYLRELYEKTGSWEKAVARYKGIRSAKNIWQRDTALYKAQKYTDEVDPQTAATVRELAPAGSGPQALPGDPAFQQQLLDILGAIAGNTQQQPPSAAPIAVK